MAPTSSNKPPVLVVGAGPTGLAAALWLTHLGVPVRIIDANAARTTLSKALVLWRRSIQVLDPVVPAEAWVARGVPVTGVTLLNSGRLVTSVDFTEATNTAPQLLQQGGAGAGGGAPDDAASLQEQQQRYAHVLPPGVNIPQSDVEDVLETALAALGVRVERRTALKSFQPDADGVDCVLERLPPQASPAVSESGAAGSGGAGGEARDPLVKLHEAFTDPTTVTGGDATAAGVGAASAAGAAAQVPTETLRAAYLVGADGAHSTVRRGLVPPVEFVGETLHMRFMLADVEFEVEDGANPNKPTCEAERDTLPGGMHMVFTPEGMLGVINMAPGVARLVMDGGPIAPGTPRQVPTLDEFRATLAKYTRLQWRLKEATWLSEFRVNERKVGAYVHGPGGRVLLAGDAAHVHSPAGGQGMNTGLQDATNLAWKVALAWSADAAGAAPAAAAAAERLLGTYSTEREPIAAAVLNYTGNALRTAMLRSPLLRWLRFLVMSTALRFSPVRASMASLMVEDTVEYPPSSALATVGGADAAVAGEAKAVVAAATAKPGCAFPDLPVVVNGALRPATDLLRGAGGSDAMCGTLVLMPKADRGAWPSSFGGRQLAVRQVGVDAQDPAGRLARALGVGDEGGVLVRPDSVVAAGGGPRVVRAWLDQHLAGL